MPETPNIKTYPEFGGKVHISNFGYGQDGLLGLTLSVNSQDFSRKDLRRLAGDLVKLADQLENLEKNQTAETN